MTRLMNPPTSAPEKLAWPVLDTSDESTTVRHLRQQARTAFEATGYPTSKTEEWRSTPVAAITQTAFAASAPVPRAVSLQDITPLLLEGDTSRLVFVNGHYDAKLSSLPQQKGVSLRLLADLAKENSALLDSLLAEKTLHEDPFSHINLALFDNGIALVVDRGVVLERPLHLLNLAVPSQTGSEPWMAHSRNLIQVGENGQAKIIEHYATLPGHAADPGTYWHNALTQITLGDHAIAEHYFIEEEGPEGRNITTLLGQLGSHSHLASHAILVGGKLVRNNIHIELRGPHAETVVNGLFIGQGHQVLDNHMRAVHGSTNCDSHQYYNGILAGHSQGVFKGRIVVEPDAQKTDAKQTNRNLILSDTARIHTDPQLEIYADDVKCTHGATTGQLDPEALFYLESRGVPAIQARAMLINAFAHESLERITLPCVLNRLEQLVTAKLANINQPG